MAKTWWQQYEAEQAAKAKEQAKAARFGVYQHAYWVNNAVVESGEGYVVREISSAVPYGKMTPVKTYKRKAAAEKHAKKLNGD